MKHFCCLLLCFLTQLDFTISDGYYVMPYVLWDSANPIFDEDQCGSESRKFKVKFNDLFRLQCGNLFSNNGLLKSMRNYGVCNYNLYVTTNKQTYENRVVTEESTFLYNCTEHITVVNNKAKPVIDNVFIGFRRISPFSAVQYKAGKTYYYFTTSDGSVESLTNLNGVDSSKHMRFEVYICEDDEPCGERTRINPCLKAEPSALSQTGSASPSSHPFYIWIIVGIAIGAILGAIFGILLRDRCHRTYQTDITTTNLDRRENSINASKSSVSNDTCAGERERLQNGTAVV